MSDDKLKIYERALAREKAARKQAEEILEEKSRELFFLAQELKKSNDKLEKLFKETTSELKGVFENIIDAYVVMNLNGEVLKMNEAAEVLFGYDIKKESLNVVSLIHKKDIAYAMQSYEELLKEGFFTDYKARIFTKNKEVKWVHINASLVYNDGGIPIAAQGIVRDITEEEADAELIREQQIKLSAIVDYSSLGIVLTQNGKILQTNKAIQELLEYSEEELLTKSVQDISVKEDYPASKVYMDQMNNNTLDHFVMKKRYKKKNGAVVWAKTNVTAVRNEDTSIRYQVALVEDITIQLKSEKERKSLLKKLEKSNEELQEYAHIVSHDLKSPLRSINALVNWIQDDNKDTLSEDSKQYLTLIETTLEKMERLISDVLEYSSVTSEKTDEQEVDVHELIKDIQQLLYIPEHIICVVKRQLPVIKSDRVRVQQLFQNIMSNAVRYIDKEKGLIEIDVVEKRSFYQFSVSDNGIGIAKEYYDKIFKIFQSLNQNKASSGIGLSIVKKIVDSYGGDIWLSSKEGIGTTFYFTLPKK